MTSNPLERGGSSDRKNILLQLEIDGERVARGIHDAISAEEIRKLLEDHDALAVRLAEEFEQEYARNNGFETLTQNKRGGRNAQWLKDSGKYFSLGYATPCVVVGIVHEDIGIAGSHRGTFAIEDTLVEMLKIKGTISGLIIPSIDGSQTERRLRGTVAQTAVEAVEEFASIAEGRIPATPLRVIIYGMSTTAQREIPKYERIIAETIRDHAALADYTGKLESALGRAGELVYGGKTHPRYSTPRFLS